jgi:hypothetical protein
VKVTRRWPIPAESTSRSIFSIQSKGVSATERRLPSSAGADASALDVASVEGVDDAAHGHRVDAIPLEKFRGIDEKGGHDPRGLARGAGVVRDRAGELERSRASHPAELDRKRILHGARRREEARVRRTG